MNRKQAINYLASSGMTDEQINEVVTAINRTETKEFKQEFLRVASYIDCLLECSDEQKETLINFIARLSEYMPWYENDDFEVERTPERTETHSCDYGRKETHGDVISRQAAIDAIVGMTTMGIEELANAGNKERFDWIKGLSDSLVKIINLPSAEPEIIRCKDCKHRPFDSEDTQGFGVEFPDEKCPCQCGDGWYNWRPNNEWYCGNAQRRENNEA